MEKLLNYVDKKLIIALTLTGIPLPLPCQKIYLTYTANYQHNFYTS